MCHIFRDNIREMEIRINQEQGVYFILVDVDGFEVTLCTLGASLYAVKFDGKDMIGFVLVRRFEEHEYFLWDYAIDVSYQNRHKGTKALIEFIDYMKIHHNAQRVTTTYVFGNEHAKHVYEKVGFVETSVVDEPDCHEVNMVYHIK